MRYNWRGRIDNVSKVLCAILALVCLLGTASALAQGFDGVNSFVCCYGPYQRAMKQFDLAAVDPGSVSDKQLSALQESGTQVIAYLTVGECDGRLQAGDGQGPGGYASWYLERNGKPWRNADWGSYYVDPGNAAWRARIIAQAGAILARGFDGLILDTLDTAELQPGLDRGMVGLVQLLRAKYPKAKLLVNRGFSVIERIAPSIDGVMFENFSSEYNFKKKTYRGLTKAERRENDAIAGRLQSLQRDCNLLVVTVDYAKRSSRTAVMKYAKTSRSWGFIPYVSTISLNRVRVR